MKVISRIRSKVARPVKRLVEATLRAVANHLIDRTKVDPRITYPSYKSFDEFIDVERLKSLDGYISERVKEHIRTRQDILFDTGLATLNRKSPQKPGSRIIYLTKSDVPFRYTIADKPVLWNSSEYAQEFRLLMDFIATLPFKATARIMIMYDDTGKPVTAHRDHVDSNAPIEFVWFRTQSEQAVLHAKSQDGREEIRGVLRCLVRHRKPVSRRG